MRFKTAFLGLVATFAFVPHTFAATPVSYDQWTPAVGDSVMVDTVNNRLFMFHENSDEYVNVPVATGQKRYVRYVGKTYYAATPIANWVIKDTNGKSGFGKTGLFMRLFWNGKDRTSYGIHSFSNIDDMLSKDPGERYMSMGCILVSEEMLQLLKTVYETNGNELKVRTVSGFAEVQTKLAELDENVIW